MKRSLIEFAILPRTHWPTLGRRVAICATSEMEVMQEAQDWCRRAENRHNIPAGELTLQRLQADETSATPGKTHRVSRPPRTPIP